MKNIQNLLDKYFEEQTSPQEEAELRAYFAGEVAAEFAMYKPVFAFVKEEQKVELGADFEANLFGNIVSELTEQYFVGETNLADEQSLREYYNSGNIAPELQKYQSWFTFLASEKIVETSIDFEAKLMTQIEGASIANPIATLTDKYFKGETTLVEEQSLQEYYNSDNIAPELQKYQSWFIFLTNEKAEQTSADFEEKIMTTIKGKSAGLKVVSRRNTWLRAVAAGVALLIGAWFFFPDMNEIKSGEGMAEVAPKKIDWSKYEITEDSAPEEVEEAMRLLAKAFNKSSKKASKELNKVGQATKVLN